MWIRMLKSTDAVLYRMMRLEALKNNPEAFLETYENASRKSIDDTAQKLQRAETQFTLGAFLQEDELVGAVTFLREREEKVRHKGHVVAMYVRPQARGQGVGAALMRALISEARQCKGLEQLTLSVVSSNVAAKRLYESMGFRRYGTEYHALKYDGRYWDEDLMVLTLS